MKKYLKILLSVLLPILIVITLIFAFNVPAWMSGAFFRLAETAYIRGDGYGARTNFRLAISLNPKDEQLRLNCVQLLMESGDTDYAAALLRDSVQELPGSLALHEMLMKALSDQGDFLATLDYIDQLSDRPVAAAVQSARPEAVGVYPEPGFYQQTISLQFSGKNVYYSLSRTQNDPGAFLKAEDSVPLTGGTYYLRALAVSDTGLVSPLFQGEYVVRAQNRTVFFTDFRFEEAVRAAIGKPEGIVTIGDLNSLTALVVDAGAPPEAVNEAPPQPPLSLSDLQWLPHLREFSVLGPVELSQTERLEKLYDLEHLRLKDCGLVNETLFSIGKLRRLKELDLSGNNLSDLKALAKLDHLESLNLSGNRISTVEALAGMSSLKELSLAANRVENIRPLTGLLKLTKLNLAQNNIHAITPLKNMTELSMLNVSGNNLPNLAGIEGLGNLLELSAANNRIYDITALTDLKAITKIDLAENNIHNILPLAGIAATTLNLANNNISSVLVLNSMLTLQELNLSNNPLHNLRPTANLPLLQKLAVAGCPMEGFELFLLPKDVEVIQ